MAMKRMFWVGLATAADVEAASKVKVAKRNSRVICRGWGSVGMNQIQRLSCRFVTGDVWRNPTKESIVLEEGRLVRSRWRPKLWS